MLIYPRLHHPCEKKKNMQQWCSTVRSAQRRTRRIDTAHSRWTVCCRTPKWMNRSPIPSWCPVHESACVDLLIQHGWEILEVFLEVSGWENHLLFGWSFQPCWITGGYTQWSKLVGWVCVPWQSHLGVPTMASRVPFLFGKMLLLNSLEVTVSSNEEDLICGIASSQLKKASLVEKKKYISCP